MGVTRAEESGVGVERYAHAVAKGYEQASQRLSELGINATDVAFGAKLFLTDSTIQQLSAEGAEATLRSLDAIGKITGPDSDALLAIVTDLHANPWDKGPLRAEAFGRTADTIAHQVEGLHVASQSAIAQTLSDGARGVDAVAHKVALDADRASLQARMSTPPRAQSLNARIAQKTTEMQAARADVPTAVSTGRSR